MTTPATGPSRAHLAVLFAVSASMLAFEVLLVRLFEFSHWHHFAGLAISLALLGLGGAGTFLVLLGDRANKLGDGLLVAGTAVQVIGTIVVLFLHSHIAIRPLFAAWDGRELARLLIVDFAAFIPFFGAGLAIAHVFTRWPSESRNIYAVNLLGSGAGSLAASGLLVVLNVENVLALTAMLPSLALLIFAPGRYRRYGAVLCVAGVAVVLRPPGPMISDFKALAQALDVPGAQVLLTQAGLPGRLTVVRSGSQRYAPGLSLDWSEPVPVADAAVVGSDRLVPLPPEFPANVPHMTASLAGLPFQLRPSGRVLILGASAWQSHLAGAGREITWVEADGRLLDLAARRGLKGPSIDLVEDGAYRYLAATDRRFGLITVDAAFSGGDAATEDYLMTVEGLAAALGRLEPDGLLVLPFKLSVPPRRAPRALNTVRRALARTAVQDPGRHVAVLRGLQELLLLVSPNPLAAGDLRQIRSFAERWRFDLAWLPGIRQWEVNRYHRLDGPVFYLTARAVFQNGELPEAARWFTDAAADLSRPYFWRSLNWQRVPHFFRAMGRQRALSYLDWTLLLTAMSAMFAALLAFVLIVAPLGRLPSRAGPHSRASIAGYFSALGLGYILLELAVFQRAVLFLGEPVAAAALVFAVFLVSSGLGSARAPQSAEPRDVARIFLAIAAGVVLTGLVLWVLTGTLLGLPWLARGAVLAAACAPLAWAMGRPFPWALSQLAGYARWVPWAWGINGFASVVAAAMASLISVQWGQPATLAVAIACYTAAAVIARGWVRHVGRKARPTTRM